MLGMCARSRRLVIESFSFMRSISPGQFQLLQKIFGSLADRLIAGILLLPPDQRAGKKHQRLV